MEYVYALLAIFLSTSVHELGHAFAMKKHGMNIKEICLLGAGSKLFEFRLTRWFGETPITLRMWPIGAFVNAEDIPTLPITAKNEISLAGVIGNARFGLFLTAVLLFLHRFEILEVVRNQSLSLNLFYFFLTLFFALFAFHKTAKFSFLPIGVIGLIIFVKSLTTSPITSYGSIANIEGISKDTPTLGLSIEYVIMIQMGMILINCIPIPPLDGGAIVSDYLIYKFPKKIIGLEKTIYWVTILVGGGLFGLMFIGDILTIYHKLF